MARNEFGYLILTNVGASFVEDENGVYCGTFAHESDARTFAAFRGMIDALEAEGFQVSQDGKLWQWATKDDPTPRGSCISEAEAWADAWFAARGMGKVE